MGEDSVSEQRNLETAKAFVAQWGKGIWVDLPWREYYDRRPMLTATGQA